MAGSRIPEREFADVGIAEDELVSQVGGLMVEAEQACNVSETDLDRYRGHPEIRVDEIEGLSLQVEEPEHGGVKANFPREVGRELLPVDGQGFPETHRNRRADEFVFDRADLIVDIALIDDGKMGPARIGDQGPEQVSFREKSRTRFRRFHPDRFFRLLFGGAEAVPAARENILSSTATSVRPSIPESFFLAIR